MKKLIKVLTAAILSVAFVGTAAGAQAQTELGNCTSIVITNTGSNSNNQGVCNVVVNVDAVCVDNKYVLNTSAQTAVSGAASAAGNTNTGAAISGGSANYNGTNIQLGNSCGPTTTPAAPVTPETPGKGAVTPAAEKPAALPYTAGNSTLAIVVSSLVAAAAIVAGSRVAVAAYRRFSAK